MGRNYFPSLEFRNICVLFMNGLSVSHGVRPMDKIGCCLRAYSRQLVAAPTFHDVPGGCAEAVHSLTS